LEWLCVSIRGYDQNCRPGSAGVGGWVNYWWMCCSRRRWTSGESRGRQWRHRSQERFARYEQSKLVTTTLPTVGPVSSVLFKNFL